MATFTAIFTETKRVEYSIRREVEADSLEAAAELVEAAYENGTFDIPLTEAEAIVVECTTHLAFEQADGTTDRLY